MLTMESTAYSPGHITGVVQTYEYLDDPINSGSKGIGFSIHKGVTTQVNITPSRINDIRIEINGETVSNATVSEYVAKSLTSNINRNLKISIKHLVDIPIGSGFGTSGAAALSLAYALNQVLGLGLSTIESAKVAHIAEVVCKTGLGTVLAEMQGGFEVRVKHGAPGIGKIIEIPLDDDYVMVALELGTKSTEQMLRELVRKNETPQLGEQFVHLFLADSSVQNFLNLSKKFSQLMNISHKLKNAAKDAEARGFICGIALFGDTLFSLVRPNEVNELKNIFSKYRIRNESIIISQIEKRGARLL
jgi:pantoate kinase